MNPFIDSDFSNKLKVYDINNVEIIWSDWNDLQIKLEQLLTPNTKVIPKIELSRSLIPTITQIRIVKMDENICPKCSEIIGEYDTTQETVWLGEPRHIHKHCVNSIVDKHITYLENEYSGDSI